MENEQVSTVTSSPRSSKAESDYPGNNDAWKTPQDTFITEPNETEVEIISAAGTDSQDANEEVVFTRARKDVKVGTSCTSLETNEELITGKLTEEPVKDRKELSNLTKQLSASAPNLHSPKLPQIGQVHEANVQNQRQRATKSKTGEQDQTISNEAHEFGNKFCNSDRIEKCDGPNERIPDSDLRGDTNIGLAKFGTDEENAEDSKIYIGRTTFVNRVASRASASKKNFGEINQRPIGLTEEVGQGYKTSEESSTEDLLKSMSNSPRYNTLHKERRKRCMSYRQTSFNEIDQKLIDPLIDSSETIEDNRKFNQRFETSIIDIESTNEDLIELRTDSSRRSVSFGILTSLTHSENPSNWIEMGELSGTLYEKLKTIKDNFNNLKAEMESFTGTRSDDRFKELFGKSLELITEMDKLCSDSDPEEELIVLLEDIYLYGDLLSQRTNESEDLLKIERSLQCIEEKFASTVKLTELNSFQQQLTDLKIKLDERDYNRHLFPRKDECIRIIENLLEVISLQKEKENHLARTIRDIESKFSDLSDEAARFYGSRSDKSYYKLYRKLTILLFELNEIEVSEYSELYSRKLTLVEELRTCISTLNFTASKSKRYRSFKYYVDCGCCTLS